MMHDIRISRCSLQVAHTNPAGLRGELHYAPKRGGRIVQTCPVMRAGWGQLEPSNPRGSGARPTNLTSRAERLTLRRFVLGLNRLRPPKVTDTVS
jgi:hypothetical protein